MPVLKYRRICSPKPTIKNLDTLQEPTMAQWMPGLIGACCADCAHCRDICPTGAIAKDQSGELEFNYGSCIACRVCIDNCPSKALVALPSIYAATSRDDLSRTYVAGGRGSDTAEKEDHQPKGKSRAIKIFAKSMHVREVDCGSCNACELEIAATGNPIYDAERLGIHIVASPRHADALFVTGPVTRQMELALRKTDAATPTPKLIVAVGSCACSGGLFGNTSVAGAGVDQFVDIDLYIPGCPPSPQAILKNIIKLRG
ncbi:MAG TPA: hypothetical protein DE036_00375 [Actinobacteria bacterium]|nr:hypothetical protein [Actinomycetota bacterium]